MAYNANECCHGVARAELAGLATPEKVWSLVQGQVCVTSWGLCDLEVKAGQDRKKGNPGSGSLGCALIPGQAVG